MLIFFPGCFLHITVGNYYKVDSKGDCVISFGSSLFEEKYNDI